MKKFLIVLLILIVLAAAALGIFIATFDADRYRPRVVDQLQKALGRPVALRRISLAWRNGISAQLEGLKIEEVAGGESLISLESAIVNVELIPLLQKNVRIKSVRLVEPQIHVSRDAQGNINLLGLAAAASPAAGATQPIASGDGQAVRLNIEMASIEQGTIHWKDALAQPVAELTINQLNVTLRHIALGQPMDVEISAAIDSRMKNLYFKGRVLPPSGAEAGWIKDGQLDIERLPIGQFLPRAATGTPKPRATISTRLNLDVPSLNPNQLLAQLSAQGSADLTDVAIENLNVLRMLFEKMSLFPGLVAQLQSHLPPKYLKQLNATETQFAPIVLPVNLRGGRLTLDRLDVKTDALRLSGQGQVGLLDQSVAVKMGAFIEPELSKAIIESVNELQALASASGEIEIPFILQGRAPQVAPVVDLQYLAKKVGVSTVINVLDRLLTPKSEVAPGSEAAANGSAQPQAPQEQAAPTTEELVGNLLRKALKKHLTEEAPAQPPQ